MSGKVFARMLPFALAILFLVLYPHRTIQAYLLTLAALMAGGATSVVLLLQLTK